MERLRGAEERRREVQDKSKGNREKKEHGGERRQSEERNHNQLHIQNKNMYESGNSNNIGRGMPAPPVPNNYGPNSHNYQPPPPNYGQPPNGFGQPPAYGQAKGYGEPNGYVQPHPHPQPQPPFQNNGMQNPLIPNQQYPYQPGNPQQYQALEEEKSQSNYGDSNHGRRRAVR